MLLVYLAAVLKFESEVSYFVLVAIYTKTSTYALNFAVCLIVYTVAP